MQTFVTLRSNPEISASTLFHPENQPLLSAIDQFSLDFFEKCLLIATLAMLN